MEALPRLPMVSLELKEPGEFPFTDSVLKYIASHYGEDPEKYADEIRKLEQLRQQVENVTKDFEGCSVLRKYFGQLHFLQSRVPMEAGQSAAVPITWLDTVSGKLVTHEDVKYEQAAVLYNLGALHSLLGAIDSRATEEGMKVSCTHFQCAAGAFTFLLEQLGPGYSNDMAASTLSLHANLMLGQAQECLLEKSMLDNRKSFLIARISAQVSDYYSNACRSLESSDAALGRFQREWRKHLRFKTLFFSSIAQYYMGKQADEQQSKYGESVAHHHAALEKLNEAVKVAKGQPDAFQEALQFAMDVVGGRYNSAKKDNDFIYHETVPPADSLPSIKGAPLVKPLPFQPTDPNVTGPDIFARLVPIEAHEASSLYSEEKANLLRDVMDKIEKKEQELQQYLDSLDLDLGKLSNPPSYDRIPQTLMERCAALSALPDATKSIVQAMTDLSGLVTDVEASMQEIENLLEEDENSERSYQEVMGPRSESGAIKELSQEWGRYVEALQKANVTNLELRKAMESHLVTLRLLAGPQEELKASLPTMTFSAEDEAARRAVQRMLGKVQEMRDQRSKLEKQLRDMIQHDDITETLVTESRSNHREVFHTELQKYDQLKKYIEQNLSAQENILLALTESNVSFAGVRKALTDQDRKWSAAVQALEASYDAHDGLLEKAAEGSCFYRDLNAKAGNLLHQTLEAYQAQELERKKDLDKKKMKTPPKRPTAPKPSLISSRNQVPTLPDNINLEDLPEDLRSLPPDVLAAILKETSIEELNPSEVLSTGPQHMPNFVPAQNRHPVSPYSQAVIHPPTFPGLQAASNAPNFQSVSRGSSHKPQFVNCIPPGMSVTLPTGLPVSQGSLNSGYGARASESSSVPGYHFTNQAVALIPSSCSADFTIAPGSLPTTKVYTTAHIPGPPSLPCKMTPPTLPGPMENSFAFAHPGGIVSHPMQQHYQGVEGNVRPSLFPGFVPNRSTPLIPSQMPHAHALSTIGQVPMFQISQGGCVATQSDNIAFPGETMGTARPSHPLQHTVPFNSFTTSCGSGFHYPEVSRSHLSPAVFSSDATCSQSIEAPRLGPTTSIHRPIFVSDHSKSNVPLNAHSSFEPRHLNHPMPKGIPPPGNFPVATVQSTRHFIGFRAPSPATLPVRTTVHPGYFTAPKEYTIHPPNWMISNASETCPQLYDNAADMAHYRTSHFIPTNAVPLVHPVFQAPAEISQHCQPRPNTTSSMCSSTLPNFGVMQFCDAVNYPPEPTSYSIDSSNVTNVRGAFPQAPARGAFPQAPVRVAFPQAPAPGAFPQAPAPGAFPQAPAPGAFPQAPAPGVAPQTVTPTAAAFLPSSVCPNHSAVMSVSAHQTHLPAVHVAAPYVSPSTSLPITDRHAQMQCMPGASGLAPSSAIPQESVVNTTPSLLSGALPSTTPATGIPQVMTTTTPSSPRAPACKSIPSLQRQSSAPDDLLSTSLDSLPTGPRPDSRPQPPLQPTKADVNAAQALQVINQDPFRRPDLLRRLQKDYEKFRRVVEKLEQPADGFSNPLEKQWRELQEVQERECRTLSISVARCYTLKNRHPDIMPYDKNRVILSGGKDDYINGSFLELSSYCPRLITTQSPLPATVADFWLMIYEQKVSVVVMLVTEHEIEKKKVVRYFPTVKGEMLVYGPLSVSLTNVRVGAQYTERMLTLQHREQSLTRTVVHLHYSCWPELGLPESVGSLLGLMSEVRTHCAHQRPLHTPIVVHCSSGVGRTGAFCLLYAATREVDAGQGLPDLPTLLRRMRMQRKYMLQEKLQLRLCYEVLCEHVAHVLQEHGAPPGTREPPLGRLPTPSAVPPAKGHSRQDLQDIVLGGDLSFSSIKATVARLSVKTPPASLPSENPSQATKLKPCSTDDDCSSTENIGDADFEELPSLPDPQDTKRPLVTLDETGRSEIVLSSFNGPSVDDANPPSSPDVALQMTGEASTLNEHSASLPTGSPDHTSPTPQEGPLRLDLLASLTPETFTLGGGRSKITKQSFLQPQPHGLASNPDNDDPLCDLDPLWSQHK